MPSEQEIKEAWEGLIFRQIMPSLEVLEAMSAYYEQEAKKDEYEMQRAESNAREYLRIALSATESAGASRGRAAMLEVLLKAMKQEV